MAVLPYYYPTTVILVDDNRNFLSNVAFQFRSDLAYRLFDNPAEALAFVSKQERMAERLQKRMVETGERLCFPPEDLSTGFHLYRHAAELGSHRRFEEVSVALIDFDIAGADGLELCRELASNGVKVVLLTGVADERLAVTAFNEGWIDYFISKSQPELMQCLKEVIDRFQQQYFSNSVRRLAAILEFADVGFLADPVSGFFFEQLRRDQGIVEHYLLPGERGFLCIDAEGNSSALLIQSEEQMRLHEEIAREEVAPQSIVTVLSKRVSVPYCDTPDGFYRADKGVGKIFLFPATRLDGAEIYYWALVPNPAFIDLERTAGYREYLNELDRRGHAFWDRQGKGEKGGKAEELPKDSSSPF